MPDEKTSWDTKTGLPDDFDFIIKGAAFGYREEYNRGESALLVWTGESPDEDADEIIFPLGKGWEVVDDGASVQHPKRRQFIDVSFMGMLINRVVKELGVDMKSRGPATSAEVWVGLGFHMKREKFEFGSGIMEEKGGKTEHLMPVAVIAGKGKKAAAGKKTPAKAAEKEEEAEATEAPEVDAALMKKLTNLAKAMGTVGKFQEAAMNISDVAADEKLMAEVLEDGAKGFYAKHHK